MCCEGCGKQSFHNVCWDCVKARHRAVMKKKCGCGRQRRERLVQTAARKWVACDRCLGPVRQVA